MDRLDKTTNLKKRLEESKKQFENIGGTKSALIQNIYFYLNQLWNEKISNSIDERDGKIQFYAHLDRYLRSIYSDKEFKEDDESLWNLELLKRFVKGEYNLIEINPELNNLIQKTNNKSKICKSLFNMCFINTIIPIEKKYFDNKKYVSYMVEGILLNRIDPTTLKKEDSDISYISFMSFLKKSGGWDSIQVNGGFGRDLSNLPNDQKNVHKIIQNYILNLTDLINHPEVELIEKKWFNNEKRKKRKKPSIPINTSINIKGNLKKYIYDTIKQNKNSWKLGYKFWVRSHWVTFKSERYKNMRGKKKWILPFLKGKGEIKNKEYYVGEKEQCWEHEKRMIKIIQEIYYNKIIEKHNRTILHGLEIDCYVPEVKIGFEYNGEQHYNHIKIFHKTNEEFEAQLERDIEKNKRAKEQGIKLITIRYDEELSKELILNKLEIIHNGKKNN